MSAVSFDGLLIISVIAVAAPVLSATVNTATGAPREQEVIVQRS
jgi:hypothetical protein